MEGSTEIKFVRTTLKDAVRTAEVWEKVITKLHGKVHRTIYSEEHSDIGIVWVGRMTVDVL